MDCNVTIMITGRTKNAQLVSQNLVLIRQLNPDTAYKTLVVDNSINENGLLNELKDFEDIAIVPGPDPIPGIPANNIGSFRHAQALNRGIENVNTKYLIIVDPDMFVVRRNWIRDTIDHMERGSFDFFGAPWHPRWYPKFRGFPCAQFFAVNLERIPKSDLDFTPSTLSHPHWIIPMFGDRIAAKYNVNNKSNLTHRDMTAISPRLLSFYRIMFGCIMSLRSVISPHEHRLRIGTSRDTGTYIWLKYRSLSKHRVSLLDPIIDPKTHFPQFRMLMYPLGLFIENLVPRAACLFYDKNSWYHVNECPFLELKTMRDLGLEGFLWQGAPFSFHLRGNHKETTGKDISQISILGHLKTLVKIPYHEIHKVISPIV